VSKVIVTADEVKKIAKLASLTLQNYQDDLFAEQFTDTLEVVKKLDQLDTSVVTGTYQVNALQNVTREDIVETERVLPQSVAIREAKITYKGYFVVPRLIDNS
jgi:aspartyl/glutamyl-tRNA(Asn/Gln) amidotransferase C subunit